MKPKPKRKLAIVRVTSSNLKDFLRQMAEEEKAETRPNEESPND